MDDLHFKLQELSSKRAVREEIYLQEISRLCEVGERCRQVLGYAKEYLKKSYIDTSSYRIDRNVKDLEDLRKLLNEEIMYIEGVTQNMMHFNRDRIYDMSPEILELHKLYEEVEFRYRKIRPTYNTLHVSTRTSVVTLPKLQTKPLKENSPTTSKDNTSNVETRDNLAIDEIVILENVDKAKNIIKKAMNGKTGIEASVVIRALIKEKLFKASTSRRKTINAIREYIGDIGSDSSITNPWSERESEVEIKRREIRKMIND